MILMRTENSMNKSWAWNCGLIKEPVEFIALVALETWDCAKQVKYQLLQPATNQVSFLPW